MQKAGPLEVRMGLKGRGFALRTKQNGQKQSLMGTTYIIVLLSNACVSTRSSSKHLHVDVNTRFPVENTGSVTAYINFVVSFLDEWNMLSKIKYS